jgi:hypothetical protein
MGLIEQLKDRWITWRTGKTREEREWDAWYNEHVNWLSPSIKQMFEKFKHVIIVDTDKFVDHTEPFTWVPNPDAKQYFWPQRPLGENCVWRFERVHWNEWEQDWQVNGLGDRDRIFVATNSDEDATMITLKYT